MTTDRTIRASLIAKGLVRPGQPTNGRAIQARRSEFKTATDKALAILRQALVRAG